VHFAGRNSDAGRRTDHTGTRRTVLGERHGTRPPRGTVLLRRGDGVGIPGQRPGSQLHPGRQAWQTRRGDRRLLVGGPAPPPSGPRTSPSAARTKRRREFWNVARRWRSARCTWATDAPGSPRTGTAPSSVSGKVRRRPGWWVGAAVRHALEAAILYGEVLDWASPSGGCTVDYAEDHVLVNAADLPPFRP
jgi:hypothetical protein